MTFESKAVFIGEVNRHPSFLRLFVTSHLVDPGFDSFLAPQEGSKDALELFKGILLGTKRPDDAAAILNDKFDAVAYSNS